MIVKRNLNQRGQGGVVRVLGAVVLVVILGRASWAQAPAAPAAPVAAPTPAMAAPAPMLTIAASEVGGSKMRSGNSARIGSISTRFGPSPST